MLIHRCADGGAHRETIASRQALLNINRFVVYNKLMLCASSHAAQETALRFLLDYHSQRGSVLVSKVQNPASGCSEQDGRPCKRRTTCCSPRLFRNIPASTNDLILALFIAASGKVIYHDISPFGWLPLFWTEGCVAQATFATPRAPFWVMY